MVQHAMEQRKQKLKPEFRIANDFLGLKTMDTNVIIQQLEENIRLRELPVEERLRLKAKLRMQ